MRKQIIQYTSPIDALVAVTKRLSTYESRQQMDSEEFFDQYSRGQLSDDIVFVEWANDYRHYLELRQKLEKILPDTVIPSDKPDIDKIIKEAEEARR